MFPINLRWWGCISSSEIKLGVAIPKFEWKVVIGRRHFNRGSWACTHPSSWNVWLPLVAKEYIPLLNEIPWILPVSLFIFRLIGDEGMTDSKFLEIRKKLHEVPTCISMLLIALIPNIPCGELVLSIKNGNKHGFCSPLTHV